MKKKAIIWGAGKIGRQVYFPLIKDYDMDIVAFVDSNRDNIGDTLYGVDIYSPKQIKNLDFEVIFIAVYALELIEQIQQQLSELGVERNQIVELATDLKYLKIFTNNRTEWLRNYAEWVNLLDIEGSVAECGVFRGDFSKFINKYFPNRKCYLFDTFEGFDIGDINQEKELNKGFEETIFNSEEIFTNTSIEFVMKKMTYPENIEIKRGYFPDSTVGVQDRFCFVSLDTDLYAPILSGLRFFWNKMEKGGCILIHDYFTGCLGGVKMAVEQFEKEQGVVIPKSTIGDFCSIALLKC